MADPSLTKVRVFDRLQDGRKVLANNGDVLTIKEISQRYMRVENARGVAGDVQYSKLRKGLAYGSAGTSHLMQGVTSANHIHALLGGSKNAQAHSLMSV